MQVTHDVCSVDSHKFHWWNRLLLHLLSLLPLATIQDPKQWHFLNQKHLIPRSNIWTDNSPPATTSTPSSKHSMTSQLKKSAFCITVCWGWWWDKPWKVFNLWKKKDMHFNCHLSFAVTDWQFDPFMNAWHHSCVHSKWWQKKSCTWPNTCRAFPPLLSCLPKGVS